MTKCYNILSLYTNFQYVSFFYLVFFVFVFIKNINEEAHTFCTNLYFNSIVIFLECQYGQKNWHSNFLSVNMSIIGVSKFNTPKIYVLQLNVAKRVCSFYNQYHYLGDFGVWSWTNKILILECENDQNWPLPYYWNWNESFLKAWKKITKHTNKKKNLCSSFLND